MPLRLIQTVLLAIYFVAFNASFEPGAQETSANFPRFGGLNGELKTVLSHRKAPQ